MPATQKAALKGDGCLHAARCAGSAVSKSNRRPRIDPVETGTGTKDLLNSRMAYVTVSRVAHRTQAFTNDAAALGQ